jgi:hypothetical protein
MLKGNRIPVRYILVLDIPDAPVENWSQTLMVFAVPFEHTKIYVGKYLFVFHEHSQHLSKAKVEELEYPIDEVTYHLDYDVYPNRQQIDQIRDNLKMYGWVLEK